MNNRILAFGVIMAVVVFVLLILFLSPEKNKTVEQGSLNWNNDLNSALTMAQNANKPVLVDFYASWCTYCREMDENTFMDPQVQQKLSGYILVKINGDQNPELLKKYQIYGYPTILLLDSNGNVIKTISGYQSPDNFVNMI